MTTRRCAHCGREKTIRGVWYLEPDHRASPFACESCFSRVGVASAP